MGKLIYGSEDMAVPTQFNIIPLADVDGETFGITSDI